MVDSPVLLIPGLGDSDPTHWQRRWEHDLPAARRVVQHDWGQPDRKRWIATLDAAIRACATRRSVAHSLGCALVAHWSVCYARIVLGALLVAPSDAELYQHEGSAAIPGLYLTRHTSTTTPRTTIEQPVFCLVAQNATSAAVS